MPIRRRCLLVVSVISGRNFIDKPSSTIIVEAKLDREVLSTDPVSHSPNPSFEQELAWEVDRASLRHYRLQRASLKLQIYTINTDETREPLGYVVLDARSATERKNFRWFPVLNAKSRPSPEIYCGLYIDPCSPSDLEGYGDANMPPLEVKRFAEKFDNESVDGFLLGETDSPTPKDCFLLSVVPVSIPQLEKLLPSSISSSSLYKLSMRFLDHDLFQWEFREDDCTKLTANHYKFFVKASMNALRARFLHPNLLEFTLFADGIAIGRCHGSLPLISDQISPSTQYPFCVDTTFTLTSPQRFNAGSQIVFRFNVTKCDTHAPLPATPTSPMQHGELSPGPPLPPPPPQPPVDVDSALAQMQQNSCTQQGSASETLPPQQPVTSRTTAPQMPSNESSHLRRFCYIIELKTIRACCEPSALKDLYVYARYVYPLFGTTSPIMTLPPVRLSATEDRHFSHGYCAFELAADFSEFKSRLLEEPLNVEILGRSLEGASVGGGLEPSLGWAVIPLGEVFTRPLIHMSNCQRRHMDGVAEVKLNGNTMAKVNFSLVLDDFGVYNTSTMAEITSFNNMEGANGDGANDQGNGCCGGGGGGGGRSPSSVPADIRQTAEYRAALELELWKAKEAERFKEGLRQREQKMLLLFSQEWKRREDEREAMCRKKLEEYEALEEKLRGVLSALLERERQLSAQEAALGAARRDIQRSLAAAAAQQQQQQAEQAVEAEARQLRERLRESQLAQQRAEQAASAELTVLREKCRDLEARLTRQQPVPSAPAGDTKADEEIRRLQLELVRLTTELSGARSELSATERRLESAVRGRLRYRELWTRALAEVTRLRDEAAAATRLEVESLRRRQQQPVPEEELTSRRCNPSGVDLQQQNASERQLSEGDIGGEKVTSRNPKKEAVVDPVLGAQLKRLQEERECLLSSGVYYEDDELIMNLDREISRLRVAISNPA